MTIRFAPNVFDVWAFERRPEGPAFFVLYTSAEKAERHFNGGRFWQIPSGVIEAGESVVGAIDRVLRRFDLRPRTIWAGEHTYLIYNRRFDEMQAIAVYAAEVEVGTVQLDPSEHAEFTWLPYRAALDRVHYRGLKDGLRSVEEYITGVDAPARELCLFPASATA